MLFQSTFRVFNPYIYQSKKFDSEAFIYKKRFKELKDVKKKIHTENALQEDIFLNYPRQIVTIEHSRNKAIMEFKTF